MIRAGLVYLFRNDQVLFIHRNGDKNDYHKGKFNGLGGKCIKNELPAICAKREVKEESGLVINKITYKGQILFPNFDNISDWLVSIYISDDFNGVLKTSCPEGDLEWIDKDHILNLPLWEGDKIFLPKLFEPGIIEGIFNYHNKKLIDYKITVIQ